MYNHLSTNPGYAGSNDALCVTNIDRIQWVSFPGAPRTYLLNGDLSLPKLNSGIGLSMNSDNIGFFNNFQFLANYAYRIAVGKGKLGIGLGLGIFTTSIHGNWISDETLYDPNKNVYLDPSIPHDAKHTAIDMDFGLFYRTNNLYLGLSSTHLTQPKNVVSPEIVLPQIMRHYYLTGGYFIQLPNPLFEIRPSIYIKNDSKIFQYDINTTLVYNKRVWGGLSYRIGDAFVVMAGCTTNNFKFAVAYDYTASKINKYTGGSYELMLGWCFSVSSGKKKGKYGSIRFL